MANAGASGTRDDSQRSGRVTAQVGRVTAQMGCRGCLGTVFKARGRAIQLMAAEVCNHPPVCPQLQKCGGEFSSLADEYGRLYRSAFDADPGSLAVVERLQRCCHLVAQAVSWAVRRATPESVR